MVKIENDCVGCACDAYPCVHCDRERTLHHYCDKCGAETLLYEYGGDELCADCLYKGLKKLGAGECAGCGYHEDMLYEYEGENICIDCITDYLVVVEGSEE